MKNHYLFLLWADDMRSTLSLGCANQRRGLVIREVLLLMILPSLLISLLLPAVHATREASRRMLCSNNLKQHALAMANFESAFQRLPSGCSESLHTPQEFSVVDREKLLYSWGAQTLPFIELASEYQTLVDSSPQDLERALQFPEARHVLQTPYGVHRCPADLTSPLLNIGRSVKLSDGELIPLALTNYVAANGSRDLEARGMAGEANGMFFAESALSFSEVPDGLSNTIMLGERAWARKNWRWYRSRAAVAFGARSVRENSYYGLADTLAAGRYRINFEAVSQPDGLGESYIRRGFSSNHAGGAQFAFGDGSVRFLSQSIDGDMDRHLQRTRTDEVDSSWERLLSRDDGQEVTEF